MTLHDKLPFDTDNKKGHARASSKTAHNFKVPFQLDLAQLESVRI
jgi:hypothetical protein